MKKLLAIGLTAIMTFSLCACGGGNQTDGTASNGNKKETQKFLDNITPETAEAKGMCGADLTWYYQDGVLVIKGTGDMNDYEQDFGDSTAPWNGYDTYNEKVHRVILDEGITSVGAWAFHHMENLAKVDFADSIKEIEENAFSYCPQLTSIELPQQLEIIGKEAFVGCENFSGSLVLPKSFVAMEHDSFLNCNITEVYLPEGIQNIALSVFYDVKGLVIPASVQKVEYIPVDLETLTFDGDAPEIVTKAIKNNADEVLGYRIAMLPTGFVYDQDLRDYTGEIEDTGVTIYYSGEGFDKYIELCPQYNWVKQ